MAPATRSSCTPHIKNTIDRFISQLNTVNIRNLHPLFMNIIEEIFGLNGKVGFKLNEVDYYKNPADYDALFKFLYPDGPFFKLCYKLISEVDAYYEYPVGNLPVTVQQEIKCQSSCPSFYREKLHFREGAMEQAFLLLNPFEHYMFCFISNLVLGSKKRSNPSLGVDKCEMKKSTAYLRLCEEYISVFLPCDDTPVFPNIRCPARIPIGEGVNILPRTSSIVRSDLVSRILDTHDAGDGPVEDIWRSYLVAHLAIDFWGSTPFQQNPMQDKDYSSTLPCTTTLCVYRYLLKHLHLFANSAGPHNTKMNDFKRGAIILFQPKIYKFIKSTVNQWPNDPSFSMVLEIWLTFIQPWRYSLADQAPVDSCLSCDSSGISRSWILFISDNFLFYTHIFQLVLKRFESINLLLQKNVNMLIRILKLYAKTNLSVFIKEIEERYLTECFYDQSKWADSITNHFSIVEALNFKYVALFSNDYTNEVLHFLKIIHHVREEAKRLATLAQSSSKTLMCFVKQIFTPGCNKRELGGLIGDIERLTMCMEMIASFFNICIPSFEDSCEVNISRKVEAPFASYHSEAETSFKMAFIGDPDAQPIQSYEIGPLVKMLCKISSCINEQYKDGITSVYHGQGYFSRLARSVLAQPKEISSIDKGNGIEKPLLKQRILPPRVSLRFLGHQLIYVYLTLITIICFLVGVPVGKAFSYAFICIFVIILTKPLFMH